MDFSNYRLYQKNYKDIFLKNKQKYVNKEKTYEGKLIIDPKTLEPIYIEDKNVSYSDIKDLYYSK